MARQTSQELQLPLSRVPLPSPVNKNRLRNLAFASLVASSLDRFVTIRLLVRLQHLITELSVMYLLFPMKSTSEDTIALEINTVRIFCFELYGQLLTLPFAAAPT